MAMTDAATVEDSGMNSSSGMIAPMTMQTAAPSRRPSLPVSGSRRRLATPSAMRLTGSRNRMSFSAGPGLMERRDSQRGSQIRLRPSIN